MADGHACRGHCSFLCSVRGEVWFTALVLGVTLHPASIWCVLDLRRPVLAEYFWGGAATRTPLIFGSMFIFFVATLPYLQRRDHVGEAPPLWQTLRPLLLFALPVGLTLAG